ncbi:MAG: NAD(P)H-binding protein [Candidatus Dormibacteria bacterium]|jgi:uncharacterized protein YbjT (DUF2867 family)|nr:NmrA family transcriptional regulator [Chloroflexota bacterium]HBV94560.1 NmrA family transcriptional regulator [Chloroflexota bacterium]
MTARILVIGGTGRLGRPVVARLRDAGCEVRVVTRHPGDHGDGIEHLVGDLRTGEGIEPALAGVTTVVNCAGSAKGDDGMARILVRAALGVGTPHLVNISVVGADRVPVRSRVDRAMFGYFAAKLAAEHEISGSGLPWTTLRATQFHDALLAVARQMSKLPVLPVPAGIRFQPVDTGEVAARVAELALGEPAGLVPEMAGPRTYAMDELLRGYLRASRRHRVLLPLHMPGGAARAIRAGANLAPEHAVLGRRTWEEVLVEQVGSSMRAVA